MAGEFSIGSVIVAIKSDLTGLKSGVTQAKRDVDDLKGKSKSLGQGFDVVTKAAGLLGLTLGAAGLVRGLQASLTAYNQQQKALAQLDAVLASTGNAAGMTKEELVKLSEEMQRNSTFADEEVLGAENLLLTFTKIGRETFPEATQAVLDMSIAMGQDLKGSAIQIGKALQDPILGMTALRRVGVNFNEQQQEMVKNLVDSGKQLEAQKFILRELAAEFGGSAKAQLNTFDGQMKQLMNRLDDFGELIGEIIVPALSLLTEGLSGNLNEATGYAKNNIQDLQVAFLGLGGAIRIIMALVIGFGKLIIGVFDSVRSLSLDPLANAAKGVANDVATAVISTENRITAVYKGENTKQTSIAKKAYDEQSQAHSAKSKKINKDLEKETQKFEDEMKKRESDFKERLNDLVIQHLDKSNKFKKDIEEETRDFGDTLAERKTSFDDSMSDMTRDHAEKVQEIKDQIDEEKEKGIDADLERIASLEARLAIEEREFTQAKEKAERRYKEETDRINKEHEVRKADLEKSLKEEEDILAKHQDEVKVAKETERMDDIERLKREFAEDQAEMKKQHEQRLVEIKERGTQEGDALGDAVAGGLSSSIGGPGGLNDVMAKSASEAGSQFASSIEQSARDAGSRFVDNFFNSIKSALQDLNKKATIKSSFNPVEDIKQLFHNFGIPGFANGGIVPGLMGAPQLIMAHGGEKIIPVGKQGNDMGGGIVINISMAGASIGNERDAESIAEKVGDKIIQRLQRSIRV